MNLLYINMISVIIPARNEGETIETVINDILSTSNLLPEQLEIVVVNDGSTDNTEQIVKKYQEIKYVFHPYPKGYGASIKEGVLNSTGEIIVTFDADGQHQAKDMLNMVRQFNNFGGLVSGDRVIYNGPKIRVPGKIILQKFAEYLVSQKIKDINCGFRVFSKKIFCKYLHLYPNGFSLSTTLLLSCLKDGFNVTYVPIEVNKRTAIGKSFVKPKDALNLLVLMFRITILFSPMRVFAPISASIGVFSLILIVYDLFNGTLSNSTVFSALSAIIIFCFGLVLDQLSIIRRSAKL
jgi:glycosyltransferase involved in cell wall biosynthesis